MALEQHHRPGALNSAWNMKFKPWVPWSAISGYGSKFRNKRVNKPKTKSRSNKRAETGKNSWVRTGLANTQKWAHREESAFFKIVCRPLSSQYSRNLEFTDPLGSKKDEIGSQVDAETGKFSHCTRNLYPC